MSKLPAPVSRLPSRKPLSKITTNTLTKRPHGNEPLLSDSPKRLKPDLHRVTALTKQKAARRSVSNAIKISRSQAVRETSGLVKNNRSTLNSGVTKSRVVKQSSNNAKLPRQPSTISSKSSCATTKTKPSSSIKPILSTDKKKLSSSNSSISSTGSAPSVSKKPKRKPWDLKGQISDLKEELASSKEKVQNKQAIAQEREATIESIFRRLEALESERRTITEERSVLSDNVSGLRRQIEEEENKNMILRREREDFMSQLRSSRKMCDELDGDLKVVRREKNTILEERDKLNEENKSLSQTMNEQQETIKELKERIFGLENDLSGQKDECKMMEEERRKLLNVVQELKGNIRVFCRVRPMLKEEEKEFGAINHIEFLGNDEKSLVILNDADKPSTYTFDKVFDINSSQEQVFKEVHQLVESALDGYNICIFAYGQTGAGKTYTMEGSGNFDSENNGIIPRAMKLMFEKCDEKLKFGWKYNLSVQHVEIYQENLQDLLSPATDSNKLEIKTVTNGGKQKVWVKNLSKHSVDNFEQVRKLLESSKSKRVTASTAANSRSSRSHSVFILKIAGSNENTHEHIEASLNLIDLAGSERVGETGSSGTRLKEAKKINGSLTQLSNVISSLANKDSHVPYRNSKLTFLLMDSLGGNSKTLMLVNVNPTRRATSETINTLRFATTVNKCHIGTAQKTIKF